MKFTIAIPAYKTLYLKECIESVLNQTENDFELIILNDASPENVPEIVGSYKDNRISYFFNEQNVGAEKVVDNWNKCLSKAKGEYFLLMGDDDVLEPNYLSNFLDVIDQNAEYNVFHCQTIIINSTGEEIAKTPKLPNYESTLVFMSQRIVNSRPQYISDFVYKTEVLKGIGGFFYLPLAQMSDDITAYSCSHPMGMANVKEYVFKYRKHNTTISSTGSELMSLQAIQKARFWIDDFLSTTPVSIDDREAYNQILNFKEQSFKNKTISILVRFFFLKLDTTIKKKQYKEIKSFFSKKDIMYAYFLYLKNSILIKIKRNK
ncbi:MAG: glycosyltransferase family 2 protein [Bacteroidales bacterium]|jgi:glycosyltransferase involved in cell wall biosynthesis|nr:glycosyltransferase family 2 protein [Bacteroidales bacterium]